MGKKLLFKNTILFYLNGNVFSNIALCREIIFCVLLQAEKILSFYEELNLRPLNSVLQHFTTEP